MYQISLTGKPYFSISPKNTLYQNHSYCEIYTLKKKTFAQINSYQLLQLLFMGNGGGGGGAKLPPLDLFQIAQKSYELWIWTFVTFHFAYPPPPPPRPPAFCPQSPKSQAITFIHKLQKF